MALWVQPGSPHDDCNTGVDHHNGVTEEMVEKAADGGALEKWKLSNSNAGLWMPYNTLGVLGTGFLCLIGTGFKLKKRM